MSDDVRKEFEQNFQLSSHIFYDTKLSKYNTLDYKYDNKAIKANFMFESYLSAHASQQARIDALEAKLAEASKDAERYNAMKNNLGYQIYDYDDIGKINIYHKNGIAKETFLYGSLLDKAIDEAIRKDKQ